MTRLRFLACVLGALLYPVTAVARHRPRQYVAQLPLLLNRQLQGRLDPREP